jgi:hypothetical protein
MLANTTLGGYGNGGSSRLGFVFDDSFLGPPPPPSTPRLNPSLPVPGPVNYNLPSAFLPPPIPYSSVIPTRPAISTPVYNPSVASVPGAPTTLDRIAGIVSNVVGAFATNRNFVPNTGAYGQYAQTQQTALGVNAAQQAAADAAVLYGSQGAGADTGAHVGSAVGNIGDQIFGVIARHPFATLLVGAGAALWLLPSPRRR